MICARACPLPKIIIRRVPKKAQNRYICTFEHINVDVEKPHFLPKYGQKKTFFGLKQCFWGVSGQL